MRIISWNLLRRVGASLDDVIWLIEREQPDLMLMQEATREIDQLAERIGGSYARSPLPGRIHGVACWSATRFASVPAIWPLQPGALVRRVCQVIDCGDFSVANVHLSHGQVLNRRQLRLIADRLPARGAVLGDYNLLGPALLPGFRDVGPRGSTHRMVDMVPIRLDRCLVRGLDCIDAEILPHRPSDHHPDPGRSAGGTTIVAPALAARAIRGATRHGPAVSAVSGRRGAGTRRHDASRRSSSAEQSSAIERRARVMTSRVRQWTGGLGATIVTLFRRSSHPAWNACIADEVC